ncbi:hypothetical protein ABKN59_006429 [Abortiporus biennis]
MQAMRHIFLFSVTQQQANNYMYISAYIRFVAHTRTNTLSLHKPYQKRGTFRFSALYAMIKATANMKSLPFGDQNSIQHWTTKNSRIFERLSRSVGGGEHHTAGSCRLSSRMSVSFDDLPLSRKIVGRSLPLGQNAAACQHKASLKLLYFFFSTSPVCIA